MPAKRAPNAFALYVKEFAAQHKGTKWGRGELMRAAAAAYRAEGLAKGPSTPKKAKAPKAPKAPAKRGPRGPRGKLAPGLHSCAGLKQKPCAVAPNCYWQPTNQRCVTRSGKAVKQMFQGSERQNMLAAIRQRYQ